MSRLFLVLYCALLFPGELLIGQDRTSVVNNSLHMDDARTYGGLSAEIEYFTFWTRGSYAPPLVSTSINGTPRPDAGVLNGQGSVLYGDDRIGGGDRAGTRITISKSVQNGWVIFASGKYFGTDPENHFRTGSDGSTILGRPFWNSETNLPDAELVAYPNVLEGNVSVSGMNQFVSTSLGFQTQLAGISNRAIWSKVAYRNIHHKDSLHVREDLTSIDPGGLVPLGTQFFVQDSFKTSNRFDGCLLGCWFSSSSEIWMCELSSGVALGAMQRKLAVDGQTVVTIPAVTPTQSPGGLLAQPTNMRQVSSTRFCVVPEFGLKFNRRLTKSTSLSFAYDFLLMPEVWRASEQIDPTVNPSQIGGGILVGNARPSVLLKEQSMWIQGLSIGLNLNW